MTSADAGDGTDAAALAALAPDDLAELLVNGELEIAGRLSDASNVTLLAEVSLQRPPGRLRLQADPRRAPALGLPGRQPGRP